MGLTKEQRANGLLHVKSLQMFVGDPTKYKAINEAINWALTPQGSNFWYQIHQQSVRGEDLEGLRHKVTLAAIENGWGEHLDLPEISDDLLWE